MFVGLVGLPNAGKSALFNALTGNRQRIANFPGITVEKRIGKLHSETEDYKIVDLPGVYTLDAHSLDEKVTRDYIFDKVKEEHADVFVLVVDTTNLKKSLYLALQLKDIGQKFVVALNMFDQSTMRGQKINLDKLSEVLGGVEVVPTVAVKGEGVKDIVAALAREAKKESEKVALSPSFQKEIKEPSYIKNKFAEVERILKDVVETKISADSFSDKVDNVVLHPFFGPIILLSILILIFQLLFAWSDPFMGAIEDGFGFLGSLASNNLSDGYLKSLIIDGIIAGVGGIMVFLPHIVFLFIIINFLEDVGYLGRAAFLLDFLMRRLGLPGKAVVPLLSSHACAIPGIMSARIIENPFQRLVTMMISPLATCSARLPVYTLLIGVIIPEEKVFGFLGMQGLTLFGLYLFGMLSAFVVAFIAKKTMAPTAPAYLLMELPPYRIPSAFSILKRALQKGWMFVKKAGSVILILSVIIWALVTFPGAPENADKPEIHYSYAAKVGRTFEPIFRPLGFDWKITTALIPSFAAREVLVAAMGTVYAIDGDDPEDEGFVSSLSNTMANEYSIGTLMALLIWFVFSPQCIATFGVMRKETNGYKMPIIFGAYTLFLAYFFAFLAKLIF